MNCSSINYSNLLTWNNTSKNTAIGIGIAATAIVATAIVLVALQALGGTALFIAGGGLGVADVIYVIILKKKQNDQFEADLRDKLKFEPKKIEKAVLLRAAGKAANADYSDLKPILETMISNWDKAKTKQDKWTHEELAFALGLDKLLITPLIGIAKKIDSNLKLPKDPSSIQIDILLQNLEQQVLRN